MSAREDIARQLAANASSQHARWDARTWKELVDGPALTLEKALGPGGEKVVRAYLELCAEAVALGYVFPAATGAVTFLDVALRQLVPARLPAVAAPARLGTLAALWNLGENLEEQPPWMSALFVRRLEQLGRIDALEALVDDVAAALEKTPLPGAPLRRGIWVDPSESDRRFLPGAMHFLTPVILCVHDRLRTAAGGRAAATCGVWLTETPLVLGSTRCAEQPAANAPSPEVAATIQANPLIDEILTTARSDAALVIALRTSQRLVAVMP